MGSPSPLFPLVARSVGLRCPGPRRPPCRSWRRPYGENFHRLLTISRHGRRQDYAGTPSSAASTSRRRSTSPADPGDGVVEEERLGELHDRVAEDGRIDRRLVGAGLDLLRDQRRDQLDDPGLTSPAPEAMMPQRRLALLLDEGAEGGSVRERAVEAVEGVEQAGAALALRARRGPRRARGSVARMITSPIRLSREPNQR